MAAPTNTGGWAKLIKIVDDSGNVIDSQNGGILVSLADALAYATDSVRAMPPLKQEIWASAVTITSTTNYTVTGLAGTSRMSIRIKVTSITNDTGRWVFTVQRKLANGDWDDLAKTRGDVGGAAATFDRTIEIVAGNTTGVLSVQSEAVTEETVSHRIWNDEIRIVARLSTGTGSITFTGEVIAVG